MAGCILEARAADGELSRQVFDMVKGPLRADVLFNYKLARGDLLHMVASVGIPDAMQADASQLELGQAFCGTAARLGAALAADAQRIQEDPAGAFVRGMGVQAYACHPLLGRDGRVLGTFSVASTLRDAFDPGEVEFLQTVSHFLAMAWDRHQAEQDLSRLTQASERRRRLYETILSNTPDLAYVFDLEHRFVYANEVLLAMWGKTWDEAIGKNCLELGYEPWHAAMHGREIDQVRATKQPVRGEVPFNGTFGPRTYDYILVPVMGPDGEVEAVAGTTRDITEYRQSRDELTSLLSSEKRRTAVLARVAQASRSVSAVRSAQGIADIMRSQVQTILEAEQAVIALGHNGRFEAGPQTLVPADLALCNQALQTGQPVRLPASPSQRAGIAAPLVDRAGKELGAILAWARPGDDFSAQDEAVLAQLAAIAAGGIENGHLYELQREQDRRKDEFLATLAHELRNPLAPIRTGLKILALASSPEAAARTRETMERQVTHMVRLIDDLLDVARITTGKMQLQKDRIDLRDAINAALEVSRPLIEAGRHGLFVAMADEPIELDADTTRIAQVVSNLLNNAAKYTPGEGRIELSVTREAAEAVIRVRDNGVGLTPDSLPSVFDLFMQLGHTIDRAQGGLGIGLALVKRVVEMHGGTVSADSDGLGHGCTFTVRLPLLRSSLPDETPALEATASPPAAPQGQRILVVDDNVDVAETMATFLDLIGHTIETAHNGADAVTAALAFRPQVAFVDIGLPGMNGYEVAERLRLEPALTGIVLVALTGWGNAEDRRKAHEAGFDHHLTKPVDLARLETMLAELDAG